MNQTGTMLSISELSDHSHMPVSTIKFYIRKELLPGPVKTGRTKGYYTLKHLNRLRLIQKCKKDGNMALDRIREIVQVINQEIEDERGGDSGSSSIQRAHIIASATGLFREKGYESVTIAHVIKTAGIGKSTFYKHFLNKKDVFLACIETILLKESESLGISGVDDEKDILKLFDKYSKLFYSVSPLWQDVINMLRSAATYKPAEFAPKLKEIIQLKIKRYENRIEKGIQQGLFRQLNTALLAVMIIGIEEYCSEYTELLLKGDQKDEAHRQRLREEVEDILLYGVIQR